jgi:hypothetical protein
MLAREHTDVQATEHFFRQIMAPSSINFTIEEAAASLEFTIKVR